MSRLVVHHLRGPIVESVHRVSVAVVDGDDQLIAQAGDPNLAVFMRSAAKPFQALPLVADGAVERFDVTSQELALACASHNSEPYQVALVRAWLTRIGCDEDALACGPHHPLWRELAVLDGSDYPPDEVPRTRLASNCSGKHTGMLALAKHHGWETAGYHQPEHPVQRRIKHEITRYTGVAADGIVEAVDGCGVVSFAVPLAAIARAYARLVASGDGAAARVVAAMLAHPNLVAGTGRLCTELMRCYPGAVLCKVGAAGIYAAALTDRGLGIALKVEDGDGRAAIVALIAVLDRLGLDPPPSALLPRFASLLVTNTRGEHVGVIRADGELAFV